jgi:hypothetical protein
MFKCSYCGKANADDSPSCGGCGTPLATGLNDVEAYKTPDSDDPRLAEAKRLMVRGALWFFGGSAVTLLTFMAAVRSPYGGTYIIAWGAIVYGAIQFFRGQASAAGHVDRNTQAQDLLDLAAQLESADRAKAVALYAEIIRTFPDTRASKEARRNVQALTSQPS